MCALPVMSLLEVRMAAHWVLLHEWLSDLAFSGASLVACAAPLRKMNLKYDKQKFKARFKMVKVALAMSRMWQLLLHSLANSSDLQEVGFLILDLMLGRPLSYMLALYLGFVNHSEVGFHILTHETQQIDRLNVCSALPWSTCHYMTPSLTVHSYSYHKVILFILLLLHWLLPESSVRRRQQLSHQNLSSRYMFRPMYQYG